MKASIKTGFVGGLIGGAAVVLTVSLLVFVGVIPKAPFVPAWQSMFGGGWVAAAVLGGLLFVVGGGIWGALFALLVPNPTVLKGVLFGILPTLFSGLFVTPVVIGGPVFNDFALLPNLIGLTMNCLIWGSLTGWYCARHIAASANAGRAGAVRAGV